MTTITEPATPGFPDVYLLAETDPVAGGEDGVDNLPHKQLAERTAYLRDQLDGVSGTVAGLSAAFDGLAASESRSGDFMSFCRAFCSSAGWRQA